ncbi:MAG: fasciclin domain-containing protein [Syntrophotaleaceae bacterium]
MPNILETIESNSSLKTLSKAVKAAGIEDALKKPGPYTFFAPSDTAFDKVNLEAILADKDKIRSILQYHLVAEKRSADELDAKNVFTLLTEYGKSLSVYLDENVIMIDNAHIVEPDIECSNGVIHIIDNVFLPQHSGWYETTA